jgi:hypothetical protein
MCFVSTYENRKTKPVETVLRKVGWGRGKMMEGVNPTKIYFKQTCKYHNVSPAQLLYANKIIKKVRRIR